ncbi:MAG TPA: ATP-binding cassette domain-containing protein [Aeromicrobium sp.]|nr:ATP-binding cassette domain-containing protein [Aeromicrobium sp.]
MTLMSHAPTSPGPTRERIRVCVAGTCRELDGPSARFGRLGFVSGADGWHLFDEGLTGGMFCDGQAVRHVLFDHQGTFTVNVGAPDGHAVDIEVLAAEPEPVPEPVVPEWPAPRPLLTLAPPLAEEVPRPDAADDLDAEPEPELEPEPEPEVEFVPTPEPEPEAVAELEPPPLPIPVVHTRTSLAPPTPQLVARRLAVQVASGRVLLSGIDVALEANTLTAVIGPSGAGKSTLLHTLAGQIPASDGGVWWRGHHLQDEYLDLRTQIGFVPQEEIQHPQLGVRQSLQFSARLRLPAGSSPGLVDERVADVIAQVGLEREQHQRIGSQLSGGQKKRVSIATELLTAPPLLFLDEPTSGLDPGRDRSVMHQLRELADDGRVIVVSTHSVLGLDLCDTVIVMARGGRLAFAGPPEDLLGHFGCDDYPQMFDLLETQKKLPPRSELDSASPSIPSRRTPLATPASSAARQFVTLVQRNIALLFADRLHLSMLVLMPLILAGLSRIVQGENGLQMFQDRYGIFRAMEANQRLTILVIAAALMGTAMSIRDLVQERAVFRREYAVGLSPGAYYASKALVFGVACFLQGVLVTRLATWGLPEQDGQGVGEWGWWEIALPLGLLSTVMALVGLWISASVRSTEQTTPSLVAVVMSQIALCGALIPVAGRPVIEQVTMFAPGRWAFTAAASSAHLDRSPRFNDDQLIAFTTQQYLYDVLGLVILGVLVCWAGVASVRRVK